MVNKRKGKFPWEKGARITLESLRGENDWAISADCRSYDETAWEIKPWTAMSSLENWGEEAMAPDGMAEGDMRWYEEDFVPLEDLQVADLFGNPMSGDFAEYDVEGCLDEHWQVEIKALASVEAESPEDEDLHNIFIGPDSVGFRVYDPDDDPEEFAPANLEWENDHLWEEFSTWMKNSHWLSSGRIQNSGKKIRMMKSSGSCQCGKRGNDRYKDRRLRLVRMSTSKFCQLAAHADCPFFIDLDNRGRLPMVIF